MTEHEIDQLLATDTAGCGLSYDDDGPVIPAPRSGRSFVLWCEDMGYAHGCLDAHID